MASISCIENCETCHIDKTNNVYERIKFFERFKNQYVHYQKNERIFSQGDICKGISIVVEGTITFRKYMKNGKTIIINKMKPGDVLGSAITFSKRSKYPYTIEADSDCVLLHLDKANVLLLCKEHTNFLEDLLTIIANQNIVLSKKLNLMSYGSVREKIASYLLDLYDDCKYIILPDSKARIAEELNIPRPSFSRELIKMREERLIDFMGRTIKIIDYNQLLDLIE